MKTNISDVIYIKALVLSLKALELNIPKQYKDQLSAVSQLAKYIFGDNLINLTLGGSAGKGNVIEGWSDLDVYIVLENYNIEEVAKYMNLVSKLDVHIGTTFYTLDEVRMGAIDSKTKVMLYEKEKYHVNPTIYGEKVYDSISYETIQRNDVETFPNVLHDFRRRFIELCNDNNKNVDKTYIKKMLVLIKCLLSHYGIFSYGYAPTVEKLYEVMRTEGYDLTPESSFDIMSSIKNIDDSKDDVIKFSTLLLEFIEHSYKLKGGKKWTRELVQEQ